MNLLTLIFYISSAYANAESLYLGKIAKIQDFTEFQLSSLKGKRSLWYFFQPGCESCRKQSQEISCLPKELPILALGVFGTTSALKKEFRHHSSRATAVYGGEDWQKKLSIKQTPTLLLVDANGMVLWKKEHKVDCTNLLKQILRHRSI